MKKSNLLTFSLLVMIVLINSTLIKANDLVLLNYEPVAENDHLQLYLNRETTEIAVKRKETGTVYYSNPQDIEENESRARGRIRDRLSSQLIINYYTPDDILTEMNNYTDSVKYGQYEIKKIGNGVEIHYIFGRQWEDKDYLPKIASKEVFQKEILDKLDGDQKQLFLDSFNLVKLVELSEKYQKVDIFNFNSDEVFGEYTLISLIQDLTNAGRNRLIENLLKWIVENRNDIRNKSEIRGDKIKTLVEFLKNDEVYLLNDRTPRWDIEDMTLILKEIGYTPEITQRIYEEINLDPPIENPVVFEVSVQYMIDEGDLLVRIPVKEVKYPKNIINKEGQQVSYPLTSISILRYFNAGNTSAKGYIFIPDGSGALINLNNNRLYTPAYSKQVYGSDYSVQRSRDMSKIEEQIYLPIFGMKNNEQAFLGIIEEGDAIGRIFADIAGRNDSYNKVGAEFNIIQVGKTSLPSQHWLFMNVYQPRPYQGILQVRYKFLEGDKANYIGMAKTYQEYLVSKGILKKMKEIEEPPFFLDLIGAIDRKRPILGVPLKVIEPLTTFADAEDIVNLLFDNNINNLIINYTGALRGGLRPIYPYKIKMENKLGGKVAYRALNNYLSNNEIPLFTELTFMNAFKKRRLDISDDAARFIDRRPARIYEEEITEYAYQRDIGEGRYVVSPRIFAELFDRNIKRLKDLGISSVSFRYLGKQLNGDYNRTVADIIDRQEALKITIAQLEKLKENGMGIVLSGVNAPYLKYVDYIIGMPVASSDYYLFDESIPFYQLVVHGYIPYSSNAINMDENYKYNLLKTIETGGNLYYKWIYREPSIIKEAEEYQDLRSVYYRDWLDNAIYYYHRTSSLLANIYNQSIISHRKVQGGVYETIYEDGTIVLVNYNKEDLFIEGVKMPGESYTVLRRGIDR
ncbi:MAG: DUF5696 domain-containing protein [Halanaerobiales bacterium]